MNIYYDINILSIIRLSSLNFQKTYWCDCNASYIFSFIDTLLINNNLIILATQHTIF